MMGAGSSDLRVGTQMLILESKCAKSMNSENVN